MVDPGKPEDKWHAAAWDEWLRALDGLTYGTVEPRDGTYELVGPHFNGNPEGIAADRFVRHGLDIAEVDRSFDGIRDYLAVHAIEGIVFAHPDGRMCKIRRNDYGFPWGAKGGKK